VLYQIIIISIFYFVEWINQCLKLSNEPIKIQRNRNRRRKREIETETE
jgi:hypothetical protein